jgi:sulfite exporter TauE/SafE
LIAPRTSSRPEAAFVLLMLQSTFWAIAGLSALPFVLGGEVFMFGLGTGSLLFALTMFMVAIGVLWRRRWARRFVIVVEVICLIGSLLLLALPIGANHGPVSLMTNVVLPIAVFVLLRKPREAFV